MTMKKILSTTTTFGKESPSLLQMISDLDFQLVMNPLNRKLNENKLSDLLAAHRPVGLLAGTEPITRSVLERAKDYLRVVSRVGTGWNNVDRDAASEYGIMVFRTTGVLTQAVAELTIGLMLSALRFIPLSDKLIRENKWEKHMGALLQKKVVGIIGFGEIGRRVGELVNAFGSRVIYYDVSPVSVSWAQSVSLLELLSQSDIITLHASGGGQILGAEKFNIISKREVIIINTARGELIDESALYEFLLSRKNSIACLDVFQNEPYDGPLCSLDNVVLMPHIGSYAREARIVMEQRAVENLFKGLEEQGEI